MLIDLWSIILFLVFCIFSWWVGKSLFKYGFKIIFGYYPTEKYNTNNNYTDTSTNANNTKDIQPTSHTYNFHPYYETNEPINVHAELSYIDSLNGDQFETYMTNLLSKVGYLHMTHTPFVNDHGLDAYGFNTQGIKTGFQFKNYTHKVPYKAIYETLGGATYYRTNVNYVITNNYFTRNTIKVCHQMNHNDHEHIIKLCNRHGLAKLIIRANVNQNRVKSFNPTNNNSAQTSDIFDTLDNELESPVSDTNNDFSSSEVHDKICPKCHAKVAKAAKFCHVCGYRFSNN